jgi:hypothetical protein
MKTTLYKLFAGLAPALVVMGLLTSAALGAPLRVPDATLQDHIVVFSSERVDAPKWFHWMNSHSLRIDNTTNRNPHIAYGGDHLYYASYTGSAWQLETVDSSYGVGKYASLALDSNNRPHISYYDSVNGALKYATHNGTSWQIATIERTFYTAASEAVLQNLALDPEATPAAVDPREWGNTFLNLPLEYYREEPANLYDETQAQVEYLESGLPIPPSDWDTLFEDVLQQESGFFPGATSSITSIDGRGVGLYSSIAIDPFNKPSISYYDANNGNLKYAYWTGSAWEIRAVDTAGDVGGYSSLAVDSNGNAHISYYDATNQDLKYARLASGVWNIYRLDTQGDVGQHTSIAVDSGRTPHISYYDSTQGNLKYARLAGSNWDIRVVDTPGDVGMFSSIALNSFNAPSISYYDHTNARLKYVRWDGSNWEVSIVANRIGRYVSLAFVNDSPRISFYDFGLGELKFASPTSTGWQVSPAIDRAADVGLYVSMKLDSNHRPHISYYDDVLDDLWYARWNGTAWEKWKIDTMGAVGRFTSLALNSAGESAHQLLRRQQHALEICLPQRRRMDDLYSG